MPSLSEYDVYIFDCDGVILDSNQLKIDAMRSALMSILSDNKKIDICVEYFRNNFGKSRFHHVEFFVNNYLDTVEEMKEHLKKNILDAYSSQCKALYLLAEVTPGFINFIESLQGHKYVASGSEQNELREVFQERGLDIYFKGIFGSPVRKSQLIAEIIASEKCGKVVMFGDAISDLEAATENEIDFIGYLAYSNVRDAMAMRCQKSGFRVIESWVKFKR